MKHKMNSQHEKKKKQTNNQNISQSRLNDINNNIEDINSTNFQRQTILLCKQFKKNNKHNVCKSRQLKLKLKLKLLSNLRRKEKKSLFKLSSLSSSSSSSSSSSWSMLTLFLFIGLILQEYLLFADCSRKFLTGLIIGTLLARGQGPQAVAYPMYSSGYGGGGGGGGGSSYGGSGSSPSYSNQPLLIIVPSGNQGSGQSGGYAGPAISSPYSMGYGGGGLAASAGEYYGDAAAGRRRRTGASFGRRGKSKLSAGANRVRGYLRSESLSTGDAAIDNQGPSSSSSSSSSAAAASSQQPLVLNFAPGTNTGMKLGQISKSTGALRRARDSSSSSSSSSMLGMRKFRSKLENNNADLKRRTAPTSSLVDLPHHNHNIMYYDEQTIL